MVLTRLSSARPAPTSLASSFPPPPPNHQHAAALSSLPPAQSDAYSAHMRLNNSDPGARRPTSPLFGAMYSSLPPREDSAAAMISHPKPVAATDSIAFDAYFAHYGALGNDQHVPHLDGHVVADEAAAVAKAAGVSEANSAPPLIPFGTAPSAASSTTSSNPTPLLPAVYYAQPQARALAFDQELASPLFDTEEYYSPYLNDILPDSSRTMPGPYGTNWDIHNGGVAHEFSPVLSDVSPAMTVSGDFGVDSSASPSPYVQDHLALFGDLTVTGPSTNPRTQPSAAAPVYSPVISPTELADLEISPAGMLPPPLPLISAVLPGAAVSTKSRPWSEDTTIDSASCEPEPTSSGVVGPATPPAEADDDQDDPDFVPSAPARPTRSAAARRRVSSSSRPNRSSASPAPHHAGGGATGTGALRITDLSAPVQDRKYQVESRTSAKAIPKNLAARRAKKLARGESVSSEREAVDEASKRRMANTLAARESRKRKAEYLAGLEEQVAVQAEEIELLKAENEQLRRERFSGAVEHVKIEVDQPHHDEAVLHDTRTHKKRRTG